MTTYTLTRAELEEAKAQRDFADKIAAARAEGRAMESARINAILAHSYKHNLCNCAPCNNVAWALIEEPLKTGEFATVPEAIAIINRTVCGVCGKA